MLQINLQNRKRFTDLESALMVARGGGTVRGVWDGHVHTAIFRMDNQRGPTVGHKECVTVLRASLGGRGV